MKLTGAQALIKSLELENVEVVFRDGVPVRNGDQFGVGRLER